MAVQGDRYNSFGKSEADVQLLNQTLELIAYTHKNGKSSKF